jgi:hypothetical protein
MKRTKTVSCVHCGEKFHPKGLPSHQKNCSQGPVAPPQEIPKPIGLTGEESKQVSYEQMLQRQARHNHVLAADFAHAAARLVSVMASMISEWR